jgi:hypothetical protein
LPHNDADSGQAAGGGFMLAAMEEVVLSEETIPLMPLVKAEK